MGFKKFVEAWNIWFWQTINIHWTYTIGVGQFSCHIIFYNQSNITRNRGYKASEIINIWNYIYISFLIMPEFQLSHAIFLIVVLIWKSKPSFVTWEYLAISNAWAFFYLSLYQIYMTAFGSIISKRSHHHRFIIYLPRTSSSCTLFETALSQSIAW